jgi:uncharacterized protein (DUF4415 family)
MSSKNSPAANTVELAFDPFDPPPLTKAQRAELQSLAELPDTTVDTSDIPPLADDFWRSAQPNPYYRPIKRQITLRLDADVIAWLRATGPGYQTRLNTLLRQAMRQGSLPAAPLGSRIAARFAGLGLTNDIEEHHAGTRLADLSE